MFTITATDAILCALLDRSESKLYGGRAYMSTHLFPADITYRHDHDDPESFLTVDAAMLAALVIPIALAVAVAVAFGAVKGIFTPTSPSIPTPD